MRSGMQCKEVVVAYNMRKQENEQPLVIVPHQSRGLVLLPSGRLGRFLSFGMPLGE